MTLTSYPQGSFKELWSIALPLMISSLSVMVMIFVDRYMLAQYSTAAHNAAVNATTVGWSFMYAMMILTSISEVFVAQYNGAGVKKKIGEPVWQMIWFSVGSIFFFVPLAIWGGRLFFNSELKEFAIAQEYFRWMMYFGPGFALYGALCGFFVGQGKTMLVTVLAVVANLLNGILDYCLIFGIEGYIPSLGPKGAAIATSGSSIFQDLVLFCIFLSPSNRKEFHTNSWKIKPKVLWQCFKVGLPGAIFVGIELMGFAAYYGMMTWVGEAYITVAGICQNVSILLYFFSEGVSKAAATVAGNLIGAKKEELIPKVLLAGTKAHLLFLTVLLTSFYFFVEILAKLFLPEASEEQLTALYPSLQAGIFCIIFYIFFEGIRMLLSGVLTAAGDTVFLFYAGTSTVWIFLVLPIYLVVVRGGAPVEAATLLCVFYSFVACIIYFRRFKTGKWREVMLTA